MNKNRLLQKEECVIRNSFWNRYIDLVKNMVIPYQWDILNDRRKDAEPSHAIDNLRIAGGKMKGHFYGQVFQDSDVYKWLEAVGNILMLERDPELEEKADSVIDLIAEAQEEDGYLDTYFSIEEPDKKWTNVLECHELYCAGHFIESAVSYYRATGKEKILQIAYKLADYLDRVFGPEEGKLHGYPGHQEIEIALLKLYDLSGNEKYLNLAGYFINTRGTNHFFEEEFEKRDHVSFWEKARTPEPNRYYNQYPYNYYNQFQSPVRLQKKAVGHAVRAVYMYTAMADLAGKTGDKELFAACRTIWDNIVKKQMYITGGIGATNSGEAFTNDYDLPNDTNYSETCASIGLIFFAQKMLMSETDSVYGDVIEQALYNTVLGGMNYEGNRFFYVNPLESVPEVCRDNTQRHHVKPERQKWFACACCPPNIARLIGGLWDYIYTASEDRVNVHLYIAGDGKIQVGESILNITQSTSYPENGKINFTVQSDSDREIGLVFRIPGWAEHYTLRLDGKEITPDQVENGYALISRCWKKAAYIELEFDMQPRFICANRRIHYDLGRAAIMRGPLVYCLEEADNGKYLAELTVDTDAGLTEEKKSELGGYVALKARGSRTQVPDTDKLYTTYCASRESTELVAVPYYLWNNRGIGEMQVWIKTGL